MHICDGGNPTLTNRSFGVVDSTLVCIRGAQPVPHKQQTCSVLHLHGSLDTIDCTTDLKLTT